jgi:hypothetical protein
MEQRFSGRSKGNSGQGTVDREQGRIARLPCLRKRKKLWKGTRYPGMFMKTHHVSRE